MIANQKIVDKILKSVGSDDNQSWYVGIATHPRNRLFVEHNVSESRGIWLFEKANSEVDARNTERYLLNHYHFRGGTGGGDHPEYVYAYKITSTTVE